MGPAIQVWSGLVPEVAGWGEDSLTPGTGDQHVVGVCRAGVSLRSLTHSQRPLEVRAAVAPIFLETEAQLK